MCIIIYKKAGFPPLKKKLYKKCWDSNQDGGSFAWYDDKQYIWHVEKGLMTFKKWWRAFNRMNFNDQSVFVIHFRKGTSGNKNGESCTHPFLITHDYEEMKKTEFSASQIAFHNGSVGFGHGELSDTMIAVKEHLAPLWKFRDSEGVNDIIEELIKADKCRWLITDGEEITMYGTWIEDDEYPGIMFSNDMYKIPRKTHSRIPTRIYSRKKLKDYLGINSLFDWAGWNTPVAPAPTTETAGGYKDAIISPNEKSRFPYTPTVLGLVDANGDVIWDDGYDSFEDLSCCPTCGSQSVYVDEHSSGVCTECGCEFSIDTGEIHDYDNEHIGKDLVGCPTCGSIVVADEWGRCPNCTDIIKPEVMEAMLTKQIADREVS